MTKSVPDSQQLKKQEVEQQTEQEQSRDILLLINNLIMREETTVKLILDCLYDLGSMNLINDKCRFSPMHRILKPVAKISRPAFRLVAWYWFQKNCPQLITDWLCQQVDFPEKERKNNQSKQKKYHQEVVILRSQVRLLTGILFTIMVLFTGSFVWLSYNLKLQQLETMQKVEEVRNK